MASDQPRTFEDAPAIRKSTPVLLGLFGPSGSGKTWSALDISSGMQEVTGKETFVIDTEANRALHYADRFQFRHVPFVAPFGPLDYLAAIQHCAKRGAGQIVIDSQSHEHEGPGGVLEMHERELDRLAGEDYKKRERMTFLAWAKAKAERRRLLNSILQINCNFIFCFRAKEKMKIIKGQEPVHLGFQPIAGDEFVYEMTMNLFLPPRSNGVPDLMPGEVGERLMLKIPQQFHGLVQKGKALDRSFGAALARWAMGEAAVTHAPGPIVAQAGAERPLLIGAPAARAEILSLLRTHFPADQGKEPEGLDALEHAFGLRSWKAVSQLGEADLLKGLAALKMNLNPAAHMEREPGMDSGTEPGEEE
jgi:hypothetical protein